MAKKKSVAPSTAVAEYFVYDDRITDFAGNKITINGHGDRVVRLPPTAATLLLDQCAIGTVPLDQVSESTRALIKQMQGISAA